MTQQLASFDFISRGVTGTSKGVRESHPRTIENVVTFVV
jgi:hypothetical protein